MNIMADAIIPHVNMMRAIHFRAPNRAISTLLGTLEKKVADEENARAEAVHLIVQAHIFFHRQHGDGDVEPIQHGEDVEQEHERDQPPGHFAQRDPLQLGLVVQH